MKIKTKFLSEIEIVEDQTIFFSKGIPGFEEYQKYIFLELSDSVFSCLQSIEQPELAFITISPFTICSDYHFNLDEETTSRLKITNPNEVEVLCIVVIPNGKVIEATANLQAPVLINKNKLLGEQTILVETDYPLRLPIWESKSMIAK